MFVKYLDARDRFELWIRFLKEHGLRHIAEIGVYRGKFAAEILTAATAIETYVMIDPWRAMPSWNKPANTDNETFERHFQDSLRATESSGNKRHILRGTTLEVAAQILDESLDFIYIDGDHTLKGISIDLITIFPKVKDGGWIAGDDFCDSIWQHPPQYEPTMVFPFAVYFAEAHGMTIYALPHNQFAMQKKLGCFSFIDLTNSYGDTGVKRHLLRPQV